MDVTLTTLAPMRIAYLRHIGPYGTAVGQFWQKTVMPWIAANGLEGRPMVGIGRDDPMVTEPAKCRYDAGVEVPDDFVARGPAVVDTLPGGRYAVVPFQGTSADIELAYAGLLREWLPASGMQTDGRPFFEYYPVDAKYDAATGAFQCRLCLPVRPA